jgi:hypothetical protein
MWFVSREQPVLFPLLNANESLHQQVLLHPEKYDAKQWPFTFYQVGR